MTDYENRPLISVIVPIYKVEKYLEKCVDSIISQTYKNLEIILVDDGSPDNCPQICDNYKEKDSRVRVIHKANGGVASARNEGRRASRGEYIAYVDSDDFLEPCMYETLMNAIEANGAEMAICTYYLYDEKSGSKISANDKYQVIEDGVYNADEILEIKEIGNAYLQLLAVWTKLCRRDIADFDFPAIRIGEDYSVSSIPFMKSKKIAVVQKPLYNYVRREGSATHLGATLDYNLETARAYLVACNIYKEYGYKKYIFCNFETAKDLIAYSTERTGMIGESKERFLKAYSEFVETYKKIKKSLSLIERAKLYNFIHFPISYAKICQYIDRKFLNEYNFLLFDPTDED